MPKVCENELLIARLNYCSKQGILEHISSIAFEIMEILKQNTHKAKDPLSLLQATSPLFFH